MLISVSFCIYLLVSYGFVLSFYYKYLDFFPFFSGSYHGSRTSVHKVMIITNRSYSTRMDVIFHILHGWTDFLTGCTVIVCASGSNNV